jgi:hypothetical protein
MENGPFIDGLPIQNGDFPWQTISHNQRVGICCVLGISRGFLPGPSMATSQERQRLSPRDGHGSGGLRRVQHRGMHLSGGLHRQVQQFFGAENAGFEEWVDLSC